MTSSPFQTRSETDCASERGAQPHKGSTLAPNFVQQPTGGCDAKYDAFDHAYCSDLIDRRRLGEPVGELRPHANHDKTPRESAAEGISRPIPEAA